MAYKKLRINLTAAGFPLLSDFMGDSVIIPQLDMDNTSPSVLGIESPNKGLKQPSMYYCENVMPTTEGIQSVAYKAVMNALPNSSQVVSQVIEARDANENFTYLAFCNSGQIYMYNLSQTTNINSSPVTTNAWVRIDNVAGNTITGWSGQGIVSVAVCGTSSGITTFICLPGVGIYTVNIIGVCLQVPTFLGGLVTNTIINITSNFNYLLITDGATISWSSASNPLDFNQVNALTTGTGNATPIAIKGKIVGLFPIGGGFMIYTSANVISAAYTQNTQYPWVFKEVANSRGVRTVRQVCQGESNTNYAYTSGGLQQLTIVEAKPVFPAVTDFLSGRVYEYWNAQLSQLQFQYLVTSLLVKLTYVQGRYLIISYCVSLPYTYALVYDTELKRWGKLAFTHAECFELNINADGTFIAYNTLASSGYPTFNSLANESFINLTTLSSESADSKRSLAFTDLLGNTSIVSWDLGNYSAQAVMFLGRFAIDRNSLCSIQEIGMENVDYSNPNFNVSVLTTMDYKDQYGTLKTPMLTSKTLLTRQYACRTTGANHSLVVQGAFNLNTCWLWMTNSGNR